MDADEPALPWPEDTEGEPSGTAGRAPAETILSVGEVNKIARRLLESVEVTVQGEVSRLVTGYAYMVYFDLRDPEATLPAVLTQRQYRSLDFVLEEGASVVVSGTLTVYERQGKYQVRVSSIRPYGEGEIRLRIERLKKKLHAEGLFEDAAKVPLPDYPERIGVVTSPRGAAVRDVTVTIGRRFPAAAVFVRGVTVQGPKAPQQISDALSFFDDEWLVDVVIVARGGGSLQDLEPFNSEEVARAISRMRTPVVSGIGHEPDVTIADLVADRRASTPTGAAEVVVPDREEVRAMLAGAAGALRRKTSAELVSAGAKVDGLRARPLFRGPEFLLGPFMQRWEKDSRELPQSPMRGLLRARHRVALIASMPAYRRAGELLKVRRSVLTVERDHLLGYASRRMERFAGLIGVEWDLVRQAASREMERRRALLEASGAKLAALDPLAVLGRGYSIALDAVTGRALRSSREVEVGAELKIRLGEGALSADVTGKE